MEAMMVVFSSLYIHPWTSYFFNNLHGKKHISEPCHVMVSRDDDPSQVTPFGEVVVSKLPFEEGIYTWN